MDQGKEINKRSRIMKYLRVSEVAERLGMDASTLAHWHKAGKLIPKIVTLGGHRRYTVDQVEEIEKKMRGEK